MKPMESYANIFTERSTFAVDPRYLKDKSCRVRSAILLKFNLTFLCWRSLSFRNQSIDLLC